MCSTKGVNHERERQKIQTKRNTTIQTAKRIPSSDWIGSMGDSRVMMPIKIYITDIILQVLSSGKWYWEVFYRASRGREEIE